MRHSATLRRSREVGAARIRYLDRDECRRLVTASPEPLRPIVRGVMLTGARYSELARRTSPLRFSPRQRNSGGAYVESRQGRLWGNLRQTSLEKITAARRTR